jgi:hypothetical protein
MDQNERRIIDDLFAKLGRVDQQAPPRDPEAEALIQRHLARLPAAPYYMAQAIVVQEQALAASQARVEQLEQELAARPAGGFLGGLFGGGEPRPSEDAPGGRPGRASAVPAGGGFMGGAVQTALGVAGGVLIANAIASAFAPDAAAADTLPEDFAEDLAAEDDLPEVEDAGDFGFDDF